MKQNEIVEPIGFFIEDDNIVVANPCTIPIELLMDIIKQNKHKKGVTGVLFLKLPISFKSKPSRTYTSAKKSINRIRKRINSKGYVKAKEGLKKLRGIGGNGRWGRGYA